ncbi:hypothetical protein ACTWPB_07385 [Nocardia sp. IBHARD005]|uniref:hypothetical protein n=1 Tax=Nocardia sp. IBHARD005 TaxID=3457765 RepID=UPI004058B8EA
MKLRIFGRHARHDFAEGRETVKELLARIDAMDVPAPPAPQDYPTATYPRFTLRQIEQRADGTAVLVSVTGLEGGVR